MNLDLEETRLRIALECLLSSALGRPISVASLRRTPSPFATLFPAEVLSITLQSGDEMSLFAKYLGSEQSDHPEKQCRDREIRVYEELLGHADLPVPRYYGSRWNETAQRRELYLEYVDDWNLKYQNLEHWFTAARQLARFHAYFAAAPESLMGCEFLLRFDARYFHAWTNRALGVVAEESTQLAADLARILSEYDRVSELLAQQPLTLVHNDLSPKNVLADRSNSPARICFVDWEMAGVGCGLMDLVHLKYGLDPISDQTMCTTYCDVLADIGLLPLTVLDLHRLLAACELHQAIYRLAFSKTWRIPLETVAQWVLEARELARQL